MKDIQYKKNFIRKFGELFSDEEVRSHGEGNCVNRMEYIGRFNPDECEFISDIDKEFGIYNGYRDLEVVIIHWNSGGFRIVNVTCDSVGAMVEDIMKRFW